MVVRAVTVLLVLGVIIVQMVVVVFANVPQEHYAVTIPVCQRVLLTLQLVQHAKVVVVHKVMIVVVVMVVVHKVNVAMENVAVLVLVVVVENAVLVNVAVVAFAVQEKLQTVVVILVVQMTVAVESVVTTMHLVADPMVVVHIVQALLFVQTTNNAMMVVPAMKVIVAKVKLNAVRITELEDAVRGRGVQIYVRMVLVLTILYVIMDVVVLPTIRMEKKEVVAVMVAVIIKNVVKIHIVVG